MSTKARSGLPVWQAIPDRLPQSIPYPPASGWRSSELKTASPPSCSSSPALSILRSTPIKKPATRAGF